MRRIFVGTTGVGLLLLGSKASGLLRDASIGRYLGVGTDADAYYLAASITTALFAGILGAIPFAAVPLVAGAETGGVQRGLLSANIRAFAVVALFAALTCILYPRELVAILTGASGELASRTASLLPVMGATFVFSAAVTMQNAILSAAGRVAPTYSVAIVNNLAFVLGLALMLPERPLEWVLLFSVAGWAIQLREPQLVMSAGAATPCTAAQLFQDARRRTGPTVLTLFSENALIFSAVAAAALFGPGAVATWSYASKIGLLAASTFSQVLTGHFLPLASRLRAQNRAAELGTLSSHIVADLVMVVTPLVVIALALTTYGAKLLLGSDASPSDIAAVSCVLVPLLCALPFQLARDMFSRLLLSGGPVTGVMLLGVVAVILLFSSGKLITGYTALPLEALGWVAASLTALQALGLARLATAQNLLSTKAGEARRQWAVATTSIVALGATALMTRAKNVHPLAVLCVGLTTLLVAVWVLNAPSPFAAGRRLLKRDTATL